MKRSIALLPVLALFCGLVWSCGSPDHKARYSRELAQAALARLETPGLVIGEFRLDRGGVIDGDTIQIAGLDTSLRLLAVDAEETFKTEADRRAFEAGWHEYLAAKREGHTRPVKVATPVGEEAKKWAREFFADVTRVRLERDHPREIRGHYNRYLVYIFARKDGAWVNYNVECVRAGMSPYFTKYGYSRRFHDQLTAAENLARSQRLGVWDPARMNYGDYDRRKEWWDARAEFIRAFERDADTRDDHIVLTNWDAIRRIEAHLGRDVTLLGAVGHIILGDRGPTRVLLSRRKFDSFALVFFDKDVFGSSGIARYEGEFVKVRGRITEYRDERRGRTELQMIIDRPGQIIGSSVPGLAPGPDRAVTTSAKAD